MVAKKFAFAAPYWCCCHSAVPLTTGSDNVLGPIIEEPQACEEKADKKEKASIQYCTKRSCNMGY